MLVERGNSKNLVIPWVKEHSLSIFLLVLFGLMVLSTWVLLQLYPAIQSGEASPFVWWLWETIVSNEADVFGAFMLVILTKFLTERGSPESGDD
jgi:hypothetical protein